MSRFNAETISLYDVAIDSEAIGSMDPVLDSLIAFEDGRKDGIPHHAYFYWHSTDWDTVPECMYQRLYRRAEENQQNRLLAQQKIVGHRRWASCRECNKSFRPGSPDNHYCSAACSHKTSAFWRRRLLTHEGVTKSVAEWAATSGINRNTLWERVRSGLSVADALSAPVATGLVRRTAKREIDFSSITAFLVANA